MCDFSLADAFKIGMLDAHDQAELIVRGELEPIDLVDAAIIRIEALDEQLASLSYRSFSQARAIALTCQNTRGGLAGVPYLLKDSLEYPGMPTLAGSRSRALEPASSAYPFARRFDRQGLIPLGKTAMPEFGLMGVTEPLLAQQPVHNPWAPHHSPGGSSGGAAAAVSSGLVPLAHGSDGAGSIRIPAACCGIVGLKPSRGSVVRARSRNVLDDMLVTDSLMSRSVRDTAWAYAVAHPREQWHMLKDPLKPRLRIAAIESNLSGNNPDPEVQIALQKAISLCESLGHHVEMVTQPTDGPACMAALLTLWAHMGGDAVESVRSVLDDSCIGDVLEPWTRNLAEWAEQLPIEDLEQAYGQLARLPLQWAAFHEDYDVVMTPVLRSPPPLLGVYTPDQAFEALRDGMFDWMGYTPQQNLAGTPAISLPLHWSPNGLPVGVMFAADRGQEDLLLSLAYELEEAVSWNTYWPPISVHTESVVPPF